MTLTTEKTVRELALEVPGATRVFEKLGIDYCCGGSQALEQACRARNLEVEEVIESLERANQAANAVPVDRNWATAPLFELTTHIRDTHHRYTRNEIARLGPLAEKVLKVHGKNHPELANIRLTFAGLAQELTSHMMKEEMMLFPYIERLERTTLDNAPVAPPPFGTVQNPVAMMMHEHDDAGTALRELRRASNDYTPPADGCMTYQTLYKALAEFEADLHQHIHLENNILFPRAIEMERKH